MEDCMKEIKMEKVLLYVTIAMEFLKLKILIGIVLSVVVILKQLKNAKI
jgi:hypothetical protein